jgi:hypothetical protein
MSRHSSRFTVALRWTAEDDAYIAANWRGKSDREMSGVLYRSEDAVKRRRFALGYRRPPSNGGGIRRPLSTRYDTMDPIIREHWGTRPVQEIADLAGETYAVIAKRAAQIGMRRLGTSNGARKGGELAGIREALRPNGYTPEQIAWAREHAKPASWCRPEEAKDAIEAAVILAHTGRDVRDLGWR